MKLLEQWGEVWVIAFVEYNKSRINCNFAVAIIHRARARMTPNNRVFLIQSNAVMRMQQMGRAHTRNA